MTQNITGAMIQNLLNINNLFNKHTNNVITLNKQLHEFAITANENIICVNLLVKQGTQEIKGIKQLVTQKLTKTVENYMNLNINTNLKNKLNTIDEIIDKYITDISKLNSKLREFDIIITEDKICIKRSSSSGPLDYNTLEDNEVANAIENVAADIAVNDVNDLIAAENAEAVADAADAEAVADAADTEAAAAAVNAAETKTKKKHNYFKIRGLRMPWSTRKRRTP